MGSLAVRSHWPQNRLVRLASTVILLSFASDSVAQSAEEIRGQEILQAAVDSWRTLQSQSATVALDWEGESTVLKHSRRDLQGNPIPAADHSFAHSVKYEIDFNGRRLRREASRELFDLSEKTFRREWLIDLYDGNTFQQFLPPLNESSSVSNSRNGPTGKLIQRGKTRTAAFIRAIDTPLFWSHGLLPIEDVEPETLTTKPTPKQFVYEGEQLLDGERVHVVRYANSDQVGRYEKYWLSEGNAWLPVRRSRYWQVNETSRLTVEYATDKQGHPVPKQWKLVTFDTGRPNEQRVTGIDSCRMKTYETDVEWNDRMFHVEPLPGMVVKDLGKESK